MVNWARQGGGGGVRLPGDCPQPRHGGLRAGRGGADSASVNTLTMVPAYDGPVALCVATVNLSNCSDVLCAYYH